MMTPWTRRNWTISAAQAWILGAGLLLSSGCGSRTQDRVGGETGFLGACGSNADCRSGLCACGVCTRVCSESDGCDDGRSTCASERNGNECASAGRRVCVPKENDTETASTPSSTSADRTSSECQDKGCVTAPTSSSVSFASTTSVDCSDGACTSDLRSTSPGEVEFRVEVTGASCPAGCGGHAVSLYHGQQRERIVTDMLQCGDDCPTPPPPFCPEVSTEPFIWDGRTNIADSVQACENVGSGPVPCETKKKYLPPGRYVAQVCLGLLDALGCELSCRDVEFDFPAREPVTLSWVNDSTNGPATGATTNEPSNTASNDGGSLQSSTATTDAGTP